jgi:hypothetical protein
MRLLTKDTSTGDIVNEQIISTTPDSTFRWSSTDQQWIFNFSTKSLKANTSYCYKIVLTDGTGIVFSFSLK